MPSEELIQERYLALARFVAQSMLPEPDRDAVKVRASMKRGQLLVEIAVPDDYRGLLIGRGGHMIRSMRSLLAAADLEAPSTVSLDIV